tara:strand:- start:4728 stop:4880 length:153 start_codon:yes stop_codon:yes gene_type:complete
MIPGEDIDVIKCQPAQYLTSKSKTSKERGISGDGRQGKVVRGADIINKLD